MLEKEPRVLHMNEQAAGGERKLGLDFKANLQGHTCSNKATASNTATPYKLMGLIFIQTTTLGNNLRTAIIISTFRNLLLASKCLKWQRSNNKPSCRCFYSLHDSQGCGQCLGWFSTNGHFHSSLSESVPFSCSWHLPVRILCENREK